MTKKTETESQLLEKADTQKLKQKVLKNKEIEFGIQDVKTSLLVENAIDLAIQKAFEFKDSEWRKHIFDSKASKRFYEQIRQEAFSEGFSKGEKSSRNWIFAEIEKNTDVNYCERLLRAWWNNRDDLIGSIHGLPFKRAKKGFEIERKDWDKMLHLFQNLQQLKQKLSKGDKE